MKTIECNKKMLFYSNIASTSRSLELLWDEENVTYNECLEALLLAEERVTVWLAAFTL